MSEYIAPLTDMRFVLEELAPLSRIEALPGCEDFNLELASAILDEAAKFASGVLSPLNASGSIVYPSGGGGSGPLRATG